jgi:hypothetical protein
MNYSLTVAEKSSFLHAIVTGSNSKENVREYLTDVLRECEIRGCSKVLIEERLKGPRLEASDVIEIATEGGNRAQGHFTAIAYVDVYAAGGLMTFAGTVAHKYGLPIKVFPTVEEAEEWLTSVE